MKFNLLFFALLLVKTLAVQAAANNEHHETKEAHQIPPAQAAQTPQFDPKIIEKAVLDLRHTNKELLENINKTESATIDGSIKTLSDLITQQDEMNKNSQLPLYNKLTEEIQELQKVLSQKQQIAATYKSAIQASEQEKQKAEAQVKTKEAEIVQAAHKESIEVLEATKKEQEKSKQELAKQVADANAQLKQAAASVKQTQQDVKKIEKEASQAAKSAQKAVVPAKK